jgi:hypothetical protein
VRNFLNLDPKSIIDNEGIVKSEILKAKTKSSLKDFKFQVEKVHSNLNERSASPFEEKEDAGADIILKICNASKIHNYFNQLLEKITNLSHSENIYKNQVGNLNTSLTLERKQNAQSLVVMNQQCERRLNVMKTYLIYNDQNEEEN